MSPRLVRLAVALAAMAPATLPAQSPAVPPADRIAAAVTLGGGGGAHWGASVDWIRARSAAGISAGLEGVGSGGSGWVAAVGGGHWSPSQRVTLEASAALGRGSFAGETTAVRRLGARGRVAVLRDVLSVEGGLRDFGMGSVDGTVLLGAGSVALGGGVTTTAGMGGPVRGALSGVHALLRVDAAGSTLAGFAGGVLGGVRPEILAESPEAPTSRAARELFVGARRVGPIDLGAVLSVVWLDDLTRLSVTLISGAALP